MVLNVTEYFQKLIDDELKTRHYEKKLTAAVVETDKLNKKMKDAITKVKDAKYLNDSDYVIGFVENQTSAPSVASTADTEDKGEEDAEEVKDEETKDVQNDAETETDDAETDSDNKEEVKDTKTDTTDTEADTEEKKDDTAEDEGSDTEGSDDTEADAEEDNSEEDDKKKEKEDKDSVNESIKVQDLTKGMLSTPKGCSKKSCSKSCGKSCGKKSCVKEAEKAPKKAPVKGKGKTKGDDTELTEAETEKTGSELKAGVEKMLKDMFNCVEGNMPEIVDVPEIAGGQNCFFVKISTKKDESLKPQ